MFAFKRKRGFFSDPVQKAATQLVFQCFHGMAHRGLRDENFFSGGGEASGAG
jgi:hypothetical protein